MSVDCLWCAFACVSVCVCVCVTVCMSLCVFVCVRERGTWIVYMSNLSQRHGGLYVYMYHSVRDLYRMAFHLSHDISKILYLCQRAPVKSRTHLIGMLGVSL